MKAITEFETDRTYYNFINAINSEETKTKYDFCLKDFMKFNNVDKPSLLLEIKIEKQIIDYILHLRNLKLSSNTIRTRKAAIYHYYAMNDVILNKTKINKYQGEFVKGAKDRAYTHDEIHKLLDVADLRMKVCILLMSSAGLRIGAIHSVQMKHLQRIDKHNLYKVTVYENTNEEYITFCTPECAKFIDEYIKYRERNGENITPESYLIRDQFDDYASLEVKVRARGITKHTIREIIAKLLMKSGVKTKEVHQNHGFRKFFTNQLLEAEPYVKTEYRWKLEGRKLKANDPHYVRPSEKVLLQEYEKGIDNLTIDPANRLQRKVETLTIEKSRVDKLEEKIRRIEKMYQK